MVPTPKSTLGPLPPWVADAEPAAAPPAARRWRLVSVVARGWIVILVALLRHARVPRGRLCPEPWPGPPDEPAPEQQPQKKKRAA